MARPVRNDIDYFPHPVSHGKKMSYLEKKYGNDGYATWFKILEELGSTEHHYLNLSDEVQIMFLSDRCMIEEETLIQIINDLVKLKEFDKELWENDKILFNEKFVESIKDAYKKRNNKCVDRNSLLTLLDGLGIRKLSKSIPKPDLSNLNGCENPQRKEKESKVKKSKEDDSKKNINNNDFFETSLKSDQWIESICITQGLKPEKLKIKLEEFKNHLISIGEQKNNMRDFKSHFINWISKNKTYSKPVIGITKNR